MNMISTAGKTKMLKFIVIFVLAFTALFICLLGYLVVDSFYLRHERAAARWEQREPIHYIYSIHISGSTFASHFQIEVFNKKIVRILNLETGSPANMWQMAPGSSLHQSGYINNYLVISRIFDLIEFTRKPSKKPLTFFYQIQPELYTSFVNKGIISNQKLGCDPSFPRVNYNRDYGYPENLVLGARRCAMIYEEKMDIYIEIESFQILP